MTIASDNCAETDDELAARFDRDMMPLLDTLFTGAMRMTLQRNDAEDLVQETMVKAYAEFRSFPPGTSLTGWLFRIQANAHISSCRERRPTETITGTIHGRQLAANPEHSARALRSAEVDGLESLPDADIRNALDALPEEFRMAVYYADVEGLAYNEIRDIMGASLDTVVSRIHRGRSQLRVLLADLAATAGTSVVAATISVGRNHINHQGSYE